MNSLTQTIVLAFLLLVSPALHAEIGDLPLSQEISLVIVDDLNNKADPQTGLGALEEPFQIGTYEVTAKQYGIFLSSVAKKSDPHHLFDQRMQDDPNVACLQRIWNQSLACFEYSTIPGRENFPITYVDLFCCAYFCNWLTLGCPSGEEGALLINAGSYMIDEDERGSFLDVIPGGSFFLPSEDQWYKAAYYHHHPQKIVSFDPQDPLPNVEDTDSLLYWNYPTQTMSEPWNGLGSSIEAANYYRANSWFSPSYTTGKPPYLTPVGSFKNTPGPYGTFDMGGDVNEWTFSLHDKNSNGITTSYSYTRGGSWACGSSEMHRQTHHELAITTKNNTTGFRIACRVIEPSKRAEEHADLTSLILEASIKNSEQEINLLKNAWSATQWVFWNGGTEVVEAIAFQYVGAYMILPYCLYMGSVIAYEYISGDYYAAAGTIVHALFDVACMLGDNIGFDVAGMISSSLERAGCGFVSDFLGTIHQGIDDLLHSMGIEHEHSMPENLQPVIEDVERMITPSSPTPRIMEPESESTTPGVDQPSLQLENGYCGESVVPIMKVKKPTRKRCADNCGQLH